MAGKAPAERPTLLLSLKLLRYQQLRCTALALISLPATRHLCKAAVELLGIPGDSKLSVMSLSSLGRPASSSSAISISRAPFYKNVLETVVQRRQIGISLTSNLPYLKTIVADAKEADRLCQNSWHHIIVYNPFSFVSVVRSQYY
ncbi:hypothetical protein GGX14DRAFT_395958 [Mycena pura]|uniref:Uncharacterized protein n=1 Tax=Mycena pura TaxID=153505 RepID=A0AAD6YGA9_9AGAR|nr:hypothetical protein GGX14DRAFT_395958 [Mycena pura]